MATDKSPRPCPFESVSLWSKVTFWWLNPLFRTGYKRRLDPEDLYDVPVADEAKLAENRLTQYWERQVKKKTDGRNASLLIALALAFKKQLMLPGILIFISEGIKIAQPFFIGQLISYFSPQSEMSYMEAYLYGCGMGLSALLQVFVNPMYFYTMQRVGMRMRTALAGVIYKKILSLNCKTFGRTTSGTIVNLLSTDIEKPVDSMDCLHYLWITPITIILTVYFIYSLVGVACTFGLALIVILLPLQIYFGRLFGKLRYKIAGWSDKRVQMMTEIIGGMRVIKMYCWEKPFSKLINNLRNKEIIFIRVSFLLKSFSDWTGEISTRLMALLVFVGHWLAGYPPIPLPNIFMTLGWFFLLRASVFIFLYYGIASLSETSASLTRIQRFLEIDDNSSIDTPSIQRIQSENVEIAIKISNMSATWGTDGGKEKSEEKKTLMNDKAFSVKDVDLTFKKGELTAVIGTVGSGKSSLLSVLLEELPTTQGEITMNGSASFSSQQPWVFSGTVRDNVLFGDDMDEQRYAAVIQACALNKDIKRMKYGDQTLVGERGLLLSGGQKARITLARAVYRDRDIYLLDDPLSAVDTKVGKHIFERCICDLLKNKTRILVTHQLQYLKAADRIVVISNGQVLDSGSYEEFSARNLDLSSLMTDTSVDNVEDSDVMKTEEETVEKVKGSAEAEVQEEEDKYSGSVNYKVYLQYFKAGMGIVFIPVILILCTAYQSLYTYSDWLLAAWTDTVYSESLLSTNNISIPNATEVSGESVSYMFIGSETTPSRGSIDVETREWRTMPPAMQMYIIVTCAYFVTKLLGNIPIAQMSATASKNLHNKMFKFILGARTKFFDENPVGRVLNRFARDIGFLDALSGRLLSTIVILLYSFLSSIIVTVIVSPWLLIPVIPALLFIAFVRHYAVQTTRGVRRLEGLARSPVYSHVSDTINGLQTIRASNKEDQFYDNFVDYQNKHTSVWFIYISSYRWFSIRSNLSLAVYITIVNFVCIALGDTIPRSLLGLALTYCSSLGEPFEYMMRISAEFENIMTSTERIVSYTRLEQEGPVTTEKPPNEKWPTSGCITFKNMSLKYSETGVPVLKNLDFYIEANEKIGIVGRTGAGKSSLVAALLRLTEPEGAVIIDDIDITKIGLHELRHKISVIPQDPVLFTGTLRINLDPFNEFEDINIWMALEQVQLRDKVHSCEGQLEMRVTESGGNFSVGERQLVCLARSLLRSNNILILDEATANVDHRTDELIQRTIRESFKDCTVLTIAHRLHTVMDSDRVLVLDDGSVKEFDKPHALLQKEDGYLRHLVRQMGSQHEKHMLTLATRTGAQE